MTCHDVANYFISYAWRVREPLDIIKLNGLLYFAQVWHVAFETGFLFDEDFEAWADGPVVPAIAARFEGVADLTTIPVDPPRVNEDIKEHLESIIQGFWDYDAQAMTVMMHKEDTWRDAWNFHLELESEPGAPFNVVIPRDHIHMHYTQIMEYGGADDRLSTRYSDTLEEIIESAKEALEMPAPMKDMALWIIIKKAERALSEETEEAE